MLNVGRSAVNEKLSKIKSVKSATICLKNMYRQEFNVKLGTRQLLKLCAMDTKNVVLDDVLETRTDAM